MFCRVRPLLESDAGAGPTSLQYPNSGRSPSYTVVCAVTIVSQIQSCAQLSDAHFCFAISLALPCHSSKLSRSRQNITVAPFCPASHVKCAAFDVINSSLSNMVPLSSRYYPTSDHLSPCACATLSRRPYKDRGPVRVRHAEGWCGVLRRPDGACTGDERAQHSTRPALTKARLCLRPCFCTWCQSGKCQPTCLDSWICFLS